MKRRKGNASLNWILSPLLPLALFVLLTVLLLATLLILKREVHHARRLHAESERRLTTRIEAQQALLAHLAGEMQELRDMPRPAAAAAISMNLTRRHQVLRLARNGEPAAQIAATLRLPLREVELLLKLRPRASAEPAETRNAGLPAKGAGASPIPD